MLLFVDQNKFVFPVYDSSGKIPSGLLNGNINQFGDFDQCLNIMEPSLNIKGKYCLAYFQLKQIEGEPTSNDINNIFKLLQSHFFFKSELTDVSLINKISLFVPSFLRLCCLFVLRKWLLVLLKPGHRVPRFSTLNWGLCIPNSCSSDDVEIHLKSLAERYSNGTGFDVEVKVEEEMCQENKKFQFSVSFLIAR